MDNANLLKHLRRIVKDVSEIDVVGGNEDADADAAKEIGFNAHAREHRTRLDLKQIYFVNI